jgi:hypothetical protein
MQGLLAFFALLAGLFKFFSNWWQRREIAKASENENLVQEYRHALQFLRESDEARSLRARLDADPKQLRRDDGYERRE